VPEGIDYAFGRPSMSALRSAGIRFVCRYLSHSPSKNLTAAEARKLTDAGIWIVVVWETTAKRALDGRAAGAADARDARDQAHACGMPDGRPVYFAVDWDASSGQQSKINAYLDGAASVLGKDRVGIYGGYWPVKRALDGGHAAWAWQTYAWSGGRWDARAQLQQYSNGHTIGGIACDYDRAEKSDYGQWRVGATPGGDDDMALVCSLGVDGTQVIDAGTNADITFTKEYSDKHGLHGENGVSVAIATAAYWVNADALFELDGLTPGTKIDVAWTRVKDDGTFIDDPWRLTYTADENGTIRDQIGGQFGVDASNRLRMCVYNTSDQAVTVRSCLAKVSLLKY
jgi:glycoside hydrolase-like protein